ncbi:SDR family NAD(P)-dependent oxidoreductase [Cupriavidus pampae]|uniref:Glucose 1-dehydrogenase n=1 Tax=Cupriavidus pampae TaxID=659251 RepID=A0ABN7YKB8_9BURK|nr:SDR family oxidoreductase [Cupriavidus pampae]CAG9173953.1 Glucose 1-dehydrogenase [Cupriavidus pampae]
MSSRKVVVITGASQGIGAQLVRSYRENGYRVVANSRNVQASHDADILAVPGDIGHPATAEAIVKAAIEAFGRIDSLVNNAGIFIAKPFTQYTIDDYDAVTGTNARGFFLITQRVIEQMMKQGHGGHVVSITTTLVDHALAGVPCMLASLTKGGINAATRSLAVEYAKVGIRVNAVAPGMILTPMHSPESYAALAGLHPLGRMGEMRDVAEAVMFLEQAPFITGEIMHVDGGMSAGH